MPKSTHMPEVSVTYHNVAQGSPEWHALRARHFCASDAPAMMGVSPYESRSELLRRLATGVAPEPDERTKALFCKGRKAEVAFRARAEQIVGEPLCPAVLTLSVDGLPLLASLDGITIAGDVVWEHKSYSELCAVHITENGEPPERYCWQLEHQLMVTGAERVLFTTSDGDARAAWCWYTSKPERRAALLSGWRQFASDLAAAKTHHVVADEVRASVPPGFGALTLRVEGRVIDSNLDAFRSGARAFLERLPRAEDLRTDQDFADAEAAIKACSQAEERIRSARESAIAQMPDVDAMLRAVDEVAQEIRTARLELERVVRVRKEATKTSLIASAVNAVKEHYERAAAGLGEFAPSAPAMLAAEFGAAIRGLKTLRSMQQKLSDAVAAAKISADELIAQARVNSELLRAAIAEHGDLWPDARDLALRLDEVALRDVIEARVARMRARASQEASQSVVEPRAEPQDAHISLAKLNELLAPLSVTGDGLRAIGVSPIAGKAKVYARAAAFGALRQHFATVIASMEKR